MVFGESRGAGPATGDCPQANAAALFPSVACRVRRADACPLRALPALAVRSSLQDCSMKAPFCAMVMLCSFFNDDTEGRKSTVQVKGLIVTKMPQPLERTTDTRGWRRWTWMMEVSCDCVFPVNWKEGKAGLSEDRWNAVDLRGEL